MFHSGARIDAAVVTSCAQTDVSSAFQHNDRVRHLLRIETDHHFIQYCGVLSLVAA
jgi:hypothetical protein